MLPKVTSAGPALATRSIPADRRALPVIGLGTWQTFDVGADVAARGRLGGVLARFSELGGAVVDSSPMYGSAEAVVGELAAAQGLRERLATDPGAAEEHGAHDPEIGGRFPLDEHRVVQQQGRATAEQHQHGADRARTNDVEQCHRLGHHASELPSSQVESAAKTHGDRMRHRRRQ